MPQRVLHLDSGREWRGGQRQVWLLAQGLRDAGVEPLVVTQPGAPLGERLRTSGLAASAIRMRADWDLAAARRVRTLIRTWKPDLVHAHDARAHAIALLALTGRTDTPLIVTRRVAFTPKGRFKYGNRVRHFIAISRAVKDALQLGGVPTDRISVVYSGIAPIPTLSPRAWREELHWPRNCVICGVVGAMSAEKGLNQLQEISDRLPHETRERMRFLFLGGSAEGDTTTGGIATHRAGFVENILPSVAGLDILVHPSTSEGLGTAVIDAMAVGVPPICFAVGGLPELVLDDQNGCLVHAGDTAAFATRLEQLVVDQSLRQRLAAAGPGRAAEFSAQRMIEGTQRVYSLAESGS